MKSPKRQFDLWKHLPKLKLDEDETFALAKALMSSLPANQLIQLVMETAGEAGKERLLMLLKVENQMERLAASHKRQPPGEQTGSI